MSMDQIEAIARDEEKQFARLFYAVQRQAYAHAKKSGFWDGVENNNLPTKLLLIISEIVEGFEEWRANKDTTYTLEGKPEGLGIELADAVIRIMDFAERNDIPLADLILTKMAYNETRPYMHGGKRV